MFQIPGWHWVYNDWDRKWGEVQKMHGFCLYLINKHRTNKCILINGDKTSDDKMVIML